MSHIPVLLHAVLNALLPDGKEVNRIIDGTLGLGGHTHALLENGAAEVLGLDLDVQAIAIAKKNLADFGERFHIANTSYVEMQTAARAQGWDQVDGILLDLGVSSLQLDTPERGFAFRHDGPLDMRFDPAGIRPPASELVNYWDAGELARIFFRYGEEPHSRRIAQAVVRERPFTSTRQLADAIEKAIPKSKKKKHTPTIHPATRVFQALRIAVNDELGTIEKALPAAIDLLAPGGRLAVISFHSLEDRIVKQTFREASKEVIPPPGMASIEEKIPVVKLVNRKPITADEAEIAQNPRSRSAKLRVVEKL